MTAAGAAPKVSVLVPCFRSAGYVSRALDSVLAQTEGDWELVAVDNASDDGTYALLQAYAARDPRVRAFRNDENLGPVRNWRRCAELARGRYAALLFSDDWWEPGFLARALPLVEGDPGVGFVYSAVDVVKGDGSPEGHGGARALYALPGPAIHPSADYLAAAYGLVKRRRVPVSPGCALLRREELARWLSVELPDAERLGYLRHGAGPDQRVFLEACAAYPRFGHLAEPQVRFLSHADNLSWRTDVKVGYARALAAFLEERGPSLPLDRELAGARLASRLLELGEAEASRRLHARLGLRGRARYLAHRWVAWRERRRGAGRS